ncbi:uncharacterized protein LOC143247003 [Tachypleus tridentatus]|uniref:uncharacterized protein LOC143247003 n=1 Tax=Tachypleus tridentatus TaxID=6853 RepID=UPI003FD69C1E
MVLFGTGGETHGGSLWYISLVDLLNGHVEKADKIYTDKYKGIMTPPVLIDITKDGVLDVVMAMFNSSVIAFDGLTFKTIWISHFPSSESYSTPGVGYFNDDAVPDFIVNYQTGPGFPVYYYTQTTILDGRTGQHLLSEPIKMVVGTQSSPLVISAEGFGNDIFLYWVSDCHGVSGEDRNLKFSFVHGTTIHEQSRADFCKLRFKERLFTRMYALNHASGPPGTIVYDSDLRQEVEHRDTLNYTEIGLRFLEKHPNYWSDYYNYPILEKRHVGPHDGGGIQRTISTGTLVKPLSEDGEINYSMDIVFATFWFYPAKTQALVPEDQECIKDRLAGEAERFQPESKYYGLDHDAYEEAVTLECLQKSGHDARYEEGTSRECRRIQSFQSSNGSDDSVSVEDIMSL